MAAVMALGLLLFVAGLFGQGGSGRTRARSRLS
jgi:hypothetical protein